MGPRTILRAVLLPLAVMLAGAVIVPSTTASAADGKTPAGTPGSGKVVQRDHTLALRDAFLASGPSASREWSTRSDGRRVTARPSDPANGDGTIFWNPTAPQRRLCGPTVCIHYVTTTSDAPPMAASDGVTPDWVRRNLEISEHSLARMVEMGYRLPPSDAGRGGTAQFDVYLADIGRAGLYGFCNPEASVERGHASSYCVFDNDFTGFTNPPLASLRVTAAHELFHAVQFGIDVKEDSWFLEATATWMEEQIADDENDNRQFLPLGQLGKPTIPLDSGDGLGVYGNWIFFQFLSQRYGADAVRQIWDLADGGPGRRDDYSIAAVRRFIESRRGHFPRIYSDFARANADPRRSYDEGATYRKARPDTSTTLGARQGVWRTRALSVPHLTSQTIALRPGAGLRKRSRVRVVVDARRRSGAAASTLVFHKSGKVTKTRIKLNRRGIGGRTVKFDRARIRRVVVVVANASTRYRCGRLTSYSCHGDSRDDKQRFDVTATVLR